MSAPTLAIQVASCSIALLGAGGILTLSLFDVPELQAQTASRSLPSIRWLFSRGSHIFPQAAALASVGFGYLAWKALPEGLLSSRAISHIPSISVGYFAASALCISIAPFTTFAMIPTNFTLIKKNEEKGGYRSSDAAEHAAKQPRPVSRSAEDSVNGEGEGSEFRDLSRPQERTTRETSSEEDQEVRQLLQKFSHLNLVRAILLGGGGVVGLWTALAL